MTARLRALKRPAVLEVEADAAGTPRFPAGALFALHDDKAVAAFDLREVARALGLSDRCMR